MTNGGNGSTNAHIQKNQWQVDTTVSHFSRIYRFMVTTSCAFACGTGGRADEMLVEAPLHEQQFALATVFIEKQTQV